MMSVLREKAKLIMWFVLIVFLLTIFAVWGAKEAFNSKQGDPDTVAKIGDAKITYSELSMAWQNKVQELTDKGEKVSEEREKTLKREILDQLIESKVRLEYAKKLGIIVSDEETAQSIANLRPFQDKDGKFSAQAYENFLMNNRINPDEFESEQKNYIILAKLRNYMYSTVKMTDDELRDFYVKRHRDVNAGYVYFNYRNMLGELKITDDQLKDYYAVNKKNYEKPEQVKASHILIQADAGITSPTGLTDEAAKKLAGEILARVKAGEDFAALAKKYSADPGSKEKGGDLGWFGRGAMVADFEDAAFKLKTGGISELVKTQFGYHIIKVTGKKEGFEPTYEKVKDKVLEELQKQEGMKLAKQKADAFRDNAVKLASLSKAAAEAGISLKETGFINTDTKTPAIDSQEYKDKLFDLNKNDISEVLAGGNGYYIFSITAEKSSSVDEKKFASERQELSDRLRSIKYNSIMEGLVKSLKASGKVEIFEKNI